jgi:chromosome segregation ATPase
MVQIIISIIGAGTLTALMNLAFGRRLQTATANKADAERQNIIADAATKAVGLIQAQLDSATRQIVSLEAEVRVLRGRLDAQAISHATEVSAYRAQIARYEADLTVLRARVSELEKELSKYRSAA